MTSFRVSAPFSPLVREDPLKPSGVKFCHKILETLRYLYGVKPEVFISPGLETVRGRDRHQDTKTESP